MFASAYYSFDQMVKRRALERDAHKFGAAARHIRAGVAGGSSALTWGPRNGETPRLGDLMARRKPRPTVREENERALLEAAESVFAERGFAGATTAAIAQRAGVPKANLHYYFPTKEGLYRSVIERVLTAWLAAASSFDTSDDPRLALSAYIGAKMDLAREMPLATRIWSAEIMRGAPMIQDFLDSTLSEWVASRERVVKRWIVAGKLKPIEPKFLFYMIWATTQQYANAAHEMATLNMGRPLDDRAFERAKTEVIEIILRGVAAA
jgi:TetR/AcrR family transcriptional regulator